MIIKQMFLEVCGPCQNDCFSCAHAGMIAAYKDYQLSIDELTKFIEHTQRSGYSIDIMRMHGIGEPLLWKHFNNGTILLKKSGIINTLSVHTNGLLIDKITDEAWKCIDKLVVSAYPDYPNFNLLYKYQERYKDKVEINNVSFFVSKPIKRYINSTPCNCVCAGPMFVKDKIFLHCGPPVFDSAALKGIDIFTCDNQYVKITDFYMKSFDEKKIGNMELCEYCWANDRIIRPIYPHNCRPSSARLFMANWYLNIRRSIGVTLKKKAPFLYTGIQRIRANWK